MVGEVYSWPYSGRWMMEAQCTTPSVAQVSISPRGGQVWTCRVTEARGTRPLEPWTERTCRPTSDHVFPQLSVLRKKVTFSATEDPTLVETMKTKGEMFLLNPSFFFVPWEENKGMIRSGNVSCTKRRTRKLEENNIYVNNSGVIYRSGNLGRI